MLLLKHHFLLTALLLAPLAALPSAEAAAKQPNILLIVADDLGWSDVGWHGGFGKTPVMDRLVKTGVELDQHYVQPVCTPMWANCALPMVMFPPLVTRMLLFVELAFDAR